MPPLSIMVKPVSGLCNMRCTYCFYADEMRNRETAAFEAMTPQTLDNLLRRAFAYAEGSVSLAFQGGEPTLAGADFFRQVLRLERRYNGRGLSVNHAIQSNGLQMSDELMDVLKEGGFLVGLSVDGTKDIHDSRRRDAGGQGTYDRVMQTARRLRERGIPYNILCVVDRQVARQGERVFEELCGHEYLQFIPCLDPLDGTQGPDSLTAQDFGQFLCAIYPRYAAMLRSGRVISVRAFDNWVQMLMGYPPENCGFLGRCMPNYLVESNGNIYPCDFYALDEWLLGNVNRQSFFTLARSERAQAFCERSHKVDDECRACPYMGLCRGGCRRDREPPMGVGELHRNRLCEGYRMFFSRYMEDMQQLARQIRQGMRIG
ncbi:MAG: radical SAM protein [Aristaeellaceae bacterium]